MGEEDGGERGADGGDVALAAHFGDEATAGPEGVEGGGERARLVDSGDPMEGGVRKDGVEGTVEVHVGSAAVQDCEAAGAGGGDHGGGGVEAGDDGTGGGELFSEGAVAAAEVEDVLAGTGCEEIEDVAGETGHEATVGGVVGGVPDLPASRWGRGGGRGLRDWLRRRGLLRR